MWLTRTNTHALVTRATDEERAWIRDYLSFPTTVWAGGQPRTDTIKMFSLVNESFPGGFLKLVTKAAEGQGFKVEMLDARAPPVPIDPAANLSWLRDYQLGAVTAVQQQTAGILWMPTGSGKTEVAAALALSVPAHWTFLVHRSTLMDQAAERYHLRTGRTAMRIGDGGWDAGARPLGSSSFTVATFQTLYQQLNSKRARQLFEETQGLLIDECHVLPADSFWKTAMKFHNAYYRIGLSGTPLARGDRRSILAIAATGSVIYRVRTEKLVEAGVLSRPTIRLLPVYQESAANTWQGVYGECIVRSTVRNKAIASAAARAKKPCLVFVKEIKHGRSLLKRMEAAGVKASFVWGSDSTEQRKAAVKSLVRGDIEVLICSVIFQEGVDIPELQSVVIGSGGKSIIAALQRIGRGMRKSADKDTFEVFDIRDDGNKWLERHSQTRINAYVSEGHRVFVDGTVST